MRSRYRIAVGGTQMDTLDNDLLILDISYSAPNFGITQTRSAILHGYDYENEYFDKQLVTVTFELHIYDVAKRNEACQKVNAWARAGGTLTTNDRPGQRLIYTRCEQFASIESARNWTDPLTVVFATTYVPYWQSVTAKTVAMKTTATKASGTIKLDGNTDNAYLNIELTASASTLTAVKVQAGDSLIWLKGLSIAKNGTLVIDHLRGRFLRIRADGKSVMSKLEPTSTDRLLIPCGENTKITITANKAFTATATARGYWI